jgi:hypothetical protein
MHRALFSKVQTNWFVPMMALQLYHEAMAKAELYSESTSCDVLWAKYG